MMFRNKTDVDCDSLIKHIDKICVEMPRFAILKQMVYIFTAEF